MVDKYKTKREKGDGCMKEVCFFCKKEFSKKHLWRITIRSPKNEEDREELFICNKCYNKIFVNRGVKVEIMKLIDITNKLSDIHFELGKINDEVLKLAIEGG